MSYYMTIERMELCCDQDISQMLASGQDWSLTYDQSKEGWVGVDEGYFKWDRESFITDLLRLCQVGVRGTVEMKGEENEWIKYEVKDEVVEEYYGEVTYPEKPDVRYGTEEGGNDDRPQRAL